MCSDVCVHACMHACVCACMHVCVCVHACVCMCMRACVCVCVCTYVRLVSTLWFSDSPVEDKMLAEGVSRFCDDAQLDPTGITVLVVAWKFQAATQCEFTRSEFVQGMVRLG